MQRDRLAFIHFSALSFPFIVDFCENVKQFGTKEARSSIASPLVQYARSRFLLDLFASKLKSKLGAA